MSDFLFYFPFDDLGPDLTQYVREASLSLALVCLLGDQVEGKLSCILRFTYCQMVLVWQRVVASCSPPSTGGSTAWATGDNQNVCCILKSFQSLC